ncbi:long chain fatty acid oxidase [Suhomyces tanzawaensis NRRL Y-17324]|uniref:Long-chain-alcohol oxidase n=1 Tax=Suhomyces tanzawaensis NRRL Y-17324 TaxID=984487 RepID=A0A1E4SBF7_9ASCO|nr:long chain fatty acid oxidase [Suhomyces tanzawaensis NRRL Y-17324]ODV76808.1 long chain fatty acid oxidase [Suhomyces tanzawaensis NRRL Y-17324]
MDVTEEHIDTVLLLMDAVVHETTVDNVLPYLDKDFPKERLEEYLKGYSRPSQIPEYRQFVRQQISASYTPTKTQRDFRFLAVLLQSRFATPLFTNSLKLISEMSIKEREELLKSWRDSPLPLKRRLHSVFTTLGLVGFARYATDLHNAAIGYPGRDTREFENQARPEFRYEMMDKPTSDGHVLSIPNVDVLIIGSGSGAGVVAQTLSEQGHKCLVLEKGKYYHESEFTFNENEARLLYENEGAVTTTDQLLFMLAGSTFGGGSTVNWSACLKTPFKVRKEWYDDYGLDWAANESYDQCMDYVWKKMGASSENLDHSQSNKVVLEGGRKLGYTVKEIAQNTGGHNPHNCGMCNFGCKRGVKQGAQALWLREALDNGCQFMDQVRVIQILHNDGKATAVLCQNELTGTRFTITGPRKFVVSGGSLNTPIVLQRSGFKNKHIGKNLKLHPVTVIFGDFGRGVKSDPHYYPIMTSVCTEKDDLDGKAHGAKIETNIHAPSIHMAFLPWDGSDNARRFQLRYNSLSSLLIITRDTTSGSVTFDPKRPDAMIVDYTANKFDRNALLQTMLIAADMLYIQGAEEILAPQSSKLTFKSSKPKEERTKTDPDYVAFRNKIANSPIEVYGTKIGSAHQMSTCRMSGKGPAYGACDTKGRLFECKNIYVADASAMPTASGANPMISTMSIARHVALGIAKDLEPQIKL